MLNPDPLGFVGPANGSFPSTIGRATRLRILEAVAINLREIALFNIKNLIDHAGTPVQER
jgi:hypothetical protein